MTQTILYARVSTTEQAVDHQLTHAQAAGFKIDEVVTDDGVSGVNVNLANRPQGKRLFDMLRKGDTLVVQWVDRLGRNYQDVTDTIRAFMQRGVIVRTVINGMTFDGVTKDPIQKAVRDALIGFMAATAEAQAEATKEAQKHGIASAKGKGDRYLGRKPSFDREKLWAVQDGLAQGISIAAISKTTGLSRQTIYRIKDTPAEAEEQLGRWEAATS